MDALRTYTRRYARFIPVGVATEDDLDTPDLPTPSTHCQKLTGRADIVVNVTPLTPQTTGLFNAAMFARMKRGAYFINVGRG